MKRIYLLFLFCCMGLVASAQHLVQPDGTATFTGAGTYCKDAIAAPLNFTFTTCNSGVGPPTGVACNIKWYYNTVNSTSIGTAVLVSSSGFLCPTSLSGTQSFIPPTSTVGDFYYFCEISWTGGTAACPGGATGSIVSTSTQHVSVNTPLSPIAPGITGFPDSVCLGSTLALSNSSPGGVWTSGNTAVASVGPSTGVVTGLSGGAAVISYSLGGCVTTRFVNVRDTPAAITPTVVPKICVGTTTTVSDVTPGGTWTSSSSGAAFVDPTTGTVYGIAAGVETITYKFPTTQCYTTRTVTVNANPAPITGATGICQGNTSTLSDVSTPGTWSSSPSAIASVGSNTGVVTGSLAGTANITYKLTGTGCFTTTVVTVSLPPAPISGPGTVCAGSAITLSDPSSGGTWNSSVPAIATVNTTGSVAGVNPGITIISYTIAGCIPATKVVNVSPLPGAITGIFNACAGLTTSYSDVTTGGHWSSSDITKATIDTFSGILTGISMGTTTITYSIPSGCSVYATVTVNPLAPIVGTDTICVGSPGASLTNIVGGGTWASSNPATASIDTFSGVVTGLIDGITFIVYTLPSACSTSFFLRVLPPLPDIVGSLELCTNSSTTLADLATGGTWSSDNSFVADINPTTGAMNGQFPGNANVTYSVYGCATTSVVTVDPLPHPTLTYNATTHALSTESYYVSYQWFDSTRDAIPGAISNVYVIPDGSQYYWVVVTDTNGCTNYSSSRNPLAVTNVNTSEISVFPNPATTKIFIKSPVAVRADVTSVTGKLLLTKEHVSELDISVLPQGIYLVSLTDETGQVVTVKKLVKE